MLIEQLPKLGNIGPGQYLDGDSLGNPGAIGIG